MKKFTALQTLLGIIAAFILVFMFVSFPATKEQVDPATQLTIQVPDYKATTFRAAGVVLITSVLIVFANKTTQTPTKRNKKNKKRSRR